MLANDQIFANRYQVGMGLPETFFSD